MTKTISAKALAQISYTFTETFNNQRTVTDSDSSQNASSYSYSASGGDNTVSSISKATGILASGGAASFDTTAFSVETLGTTYNVNYTGIKAVVVSNTSTTKGYDLSVTATGANPITSILYGSTGNFTIKPASSFIWNDPFDGVISDASNKAFELNDVGGSGTTYSITIMGLT